MNRTEEELLEEVANIGDYDTAAEALHQLKHLHKAVAEHLAVDILRDNKGDEISRHRLSRRFTQSTSIKALS